MTAQRRKTRPVPSFETFVVVHKGLDRVKNLMSLYDDAVDGRTVKHQAPASDILRAAVVLLHAIMEEYVRHVGTGALPVADSQQLAQVPLVGQQRGSKFDLGALAAHRGRTVDQIIAESVRYYLAQKSFSSLGDILRLLDAAGIPASKLRIRRAVLQRLIERRHQIVHEADQVPTRKPRSYEPRTLSRTQVVGWLAAVERLINEVDRRWNRGRWSS